MPASKEVIASTEIAAHAILEKLGIDLVAIDMSDQLVLCEVFLIATGQNIPQVEAIADEVERKLSEVGEKPFRRENGLEWILIDYSDLVVHIQSQELRNYYMLDRLWNDCPKINLDSVRQAHSHA
ncbi:MAG: ribosome silencing factor [Actinobacteria bacterium]|nr:ribosome silencing factor [Actinomycetota bacterium]